MRCWRRLWFAQMCLRENSSSMQLIRPVRVTGPVGRADPFAEFGQRKHESHLPCRDDRMHSFLVSGSTHLGSWGRILNEFQVKAGPSDALSSPDSSLTEAACTSFRDQISLLPWTSWERRYELALSIVQLWALSIITTLIGPSSFEVFPFGTFIPFLSVFLLLSAQPRCLWGALSVPHSGILF